MKQNMEKQAKRIVIEETRVLLLHDINALSISWTVEVFNESLRLFFLKWEVDGNLIVKSVVNHFRREWTTNNLRRWSRGHAPHNCVVNNNGLEATNNVIKNEVTERRLLPIMDFLVEAGRFVTVRSERKDETSITYAPFARVKTMKTKDWVDSYRWTKCKEKQIRLSGAVYVVIHKGVNGNLTDAKASSLVDKFTNFTFATFDEFTTLTYNCCILRVDMNRTEGYDCTCHQNAKEFSCIHSVGVAIIRHTMVPPAAARVTLLGRKRRRGRRPMAVPAWQHQPFDILSPLAHPQQDPEILAGLAPNHIPAEIVNVAAVAAVAMNDILEE